METFAPVRLQRLTSFVPWALISLILLWGGQLGGSAVDKAIGYGGAIVFAVVAFRAARLRMLLGEEVLVIGWLGTKRYPWAQVEKFVVNSKGLAIRLRGGLEEQVPAFPMGGWLLRSMRNSMVADLERVAGAAERFRRERRGRR